MTVLAGNSHLVDLVNDHDEVYELWKSRGIYQATLVHLDQHADFKWISEKSPQSLLDSPSLHEVDHALASTQGWAVGHRLHRSLHLGNYLSRVFQEKMVRKWYWVVPDPQWNSPHRKYEIWQNLIDLYKYKSGPMDYPKVEGKIFRTSFWGVETIVTSLAELPAISEPVLLNIDVDYFASQSLIKLPKPSAMRVLEPWIWPEDFWIEFQAKQIQFSCAAVSHSVNGGFTPIQMKFFGKLICNLLQGLPLSEAYYQLKKSWSLMHQGNFKEALRVLDQFSSEGTLEATRLFFKSICYFEEHDRNRAREAHEEAVKYDPEFASIYSSFALQYEDEGRYKEAHQEYLRMKETLPCEAWPRLGEAFYLTKRREWRKAATAYLDVILDYPDHESAHRHLGEIYLQFSQYPKAQNHFEKALKQNPHEPLTRLGLAECKIFERRYEEAKTELREALRLGWHQPRTYSLLSEVYLRQGNASKAFECFFESMRLRALIFRDDLKQTFAQILSL